jgi:hypothetical protein
MNKFIKQIKDLLAKFEQANQKNVKKTLISKEPTMSAPKKSSDKLYRKVSSKVTDSKGPVKFKGPKKNTVLSSKKIKPNKAKQKANKGYKIPSVNTTVNPQGFIERVPKYFNIICSEYLEGITLTYTLDEMVDQVVNHHNSLIKNNGIVEGTRLFNMHRLYIINSLEGETPDNPPFMAVSVKYKFPSKLFKLLGLFIHITVNKCSKCDRVMRSLLYLNRLSKANNVIDMTEILKDFQVDTKFKQEFRYFIRD